MSDMTFSLDPLPIKSSKKHIDQINTSIHLVAIDKGPQSPHILWLVDERPSDVMLISIKNLIKQQLADYSVDIVVATNIDVSIDTMKSEGVYRFFSRTRSDFLQYVKPGRTVTVTSGYALNALTLSSDLSVYCFYDHVFNQSYFYSSYTATWVFPTDSLSAAMKFKGGYPIWADNSKFKFLTYQLATLKSLHKDLKNPIRIPSLEIVRAQSPAEVSDILKAHMHVNTVAWDIETDSFNFVTGTVGCVTFSTDGKTGFYLPWRYIQVEQLSEFFASNPNQIGQNLKFDIKYLQRQGVTGLNVTSDTLPLGQTLNEMRLNGLKSLAYYYTPYGGYDAKLDEYLNTVRPPTYLDIPEAILSQYATMDAIVNFRVHEQMQQQLDRLDTLYPPPQPSHWTIRQYYERARLPVFKTFIGIEYKGIPVDLARWDTNSDIVEDKIRSLHDKIFKQLDVNAVLGGSGLTLGSLYGADSVDIFDEDDSESEDYSRDSKKLSSPQKLGLILERKGWKDYGRSKAGIYLTGDDQLLRWEKDGHSEASIIKQLRSYRTLQKTFLGKKGTTIGWRNHIRYHEEDGTSRIHSSYRTMGTESGRNACSDPNWQQLPSSSLDAHLMKQVISVPDPEQYILCTLDYASLQMRLAAIDSEDPLLAGSYRRDPDVDMHSKTGYNIFCKNVEFELDRVQLTDNGVTKTFWADEEIRVLRAGKLIKVKARDVLETDTFPT